VTQPFRLATGGRVDRHRPIRFVFAGKAYGGYVGDTLASALLANGIHFVARSFKYHRPRGIVTAGPEEPNALVQLGLGAHEEPNARATTIELYDGLVAAPVNGWPSLRFDLGALNRLAAPILVPGFYYKTFMGPLWRPVFEPLIRRMAGLGSAPDEPDADRYETMHAHCDVLVVGTGPAGLEAALAAAHAGARVILAGEQPFVGGALLDRAERQDWLEGVVREIATLADMRLLTRTTIFGYYDDNYLCGIERAAPTAPGPRERLWKIRAGRVVLATGGHERPLVFADNDRPGIMLASAVRAYINHYGVVPGRRAVIFANNDDGLEVERDLAAAGVEIAAVLDLRKGEAVTGTEGRARLRRVETVSGARIECDLLAMSGGWNPAVHLFCQSGGKLHWDDRLSCFLPGTPRQTLEVVGSAMGDGIDPPASALSVPARRRRAKRFVDYQTDTTADDIGLAVQEGMRSVEHMKRYTTAGLGTDQGKIGNIGAFALLAASRGTSPAETGTTTFRAPYTPVTFGAMAGRDVGALADPVRTTPLHAEHLAAGAVFEDVGQWKRPRYYPRGDEDMEAAVARECGAVRDTLGVLDASTLGKIVLQGRDAATFLDRIYTGRMSTLGIGRCRYGVMCRDDGMVFDDGVVARLDDERWLVTTTTGNAAAVLDWLEEWLQTEWPELDVACTSVSEHWAVVTFAGPRAASLFPDLGGMPPMSVRETTLGSIPARVATISFTGGPSFEVSVPAPYAASLWRAGLDAGAVPFGTEAMHLLRAEMGYFMVGQETDGSVTPLDLGLDRLIAWDKEFIGSRSLRRSALAQPDRRQLVGLAPDAPVIEGAQIEPGPGHVTSSYRTAVLGMLAGGRRRIGDRVEVLFDGRRVNARVVEPHFASAVAPPMSGVPLAIAAAVAPPDVVPMSSVRASPEEVERVLGVRPAAPNMVAEGERFRVLWLGPDEFLIVGAAALGALRSVDVTHNREILRVARWGVLAKGCGLDLDPRFFPPGRCAQSLLARTQVILEARPEDTLVYVRPSYATYLRAWLSDAAS
jgi:sarcosine oxidase subunit alpha